MGLPAAICWIGRHLLCDRHQLPFQSFLNIELHNPDDIVDDARGMAELRDQ